MSDKKTFVLDTNVLLCDQNSIDAFQDNDVVIPLVVLTELDKMKSRIDDVGMIARAQNRKLDNLRKQGNLRDGVQLLGGGKLYVIATDSSDLSNFPIELSNVNISDNLIIALAMRLSKTLKDRVVLVSKDINVRFKCDCLGIESQDYMHIRIEPSEAGFYTGSKTIEVNKDVIDKIYDSDSILASELALNETFFPNQMVIMKSFSGASVITRFIAQTQTFRIMNRKKSAFGLTTKNKEQQFALDLLIDESVKLVTLLGASGGGKTILALAAALEQLNGVGEARKYEKLIVSRPIQPLGKDIGFLPGTMEEKMEPWIAPIKDNLKFFFMNNRKSNGLKKGEDEYLSLLFNSGVIEIEAITFIRGRSIPRSIIIIDEAQNLSMHELKTIITRVGEGTKIILTGDVEQIDNTHVDVYTNGLTYAVEKFKEYPIAGHVVLMKGERSELATLAAKIL